MKTIKKSLKFIGKSFLGILIFLIVYVLAAFILSKITVNSESDQQAQEVPIYIRTNGVHTDIVVPVKNSIKDWSQQIKFENTQSKDTMAQYLAFGWGDKGFYLDTPEWSDLKASTAFNAAFGLGNSAMHTTFYKSINENKDCVKVLISQVNYQKLTDYIESSFQLDAAQNPLFITATTYGKNDSFYEAYGKYNLFYTCNSLANGALKASNQKAAFWTVTDTGIFCHYQ
ncbi:TIGR02117 family protein [Flavobacterium sp.]|uniref:TIGR02117 family protein n=1 Tax=Flavobacterium sp. TaxID=239 RepID=UPI002489FC45|nr:TIGR02117 family protein [Flavobacterium sp.]MDI1317507.1 TIGR02117 family protein [Flavobacterium sp.]